MEFYPTGRITEILIVFISFIACFLLAKIFPVLEQFWPLIFVYEGILAQLSKSLWKRHVLFYAGLISGFLWLIREPQWKGVLITCLGCYFLGRGLGRLAEAVRDSHFEEEDSYKKSQATILNMKIRENKVPEKFQEKVVPFQRKR